MKQEEKELILDKAKSWFENVIAKNHISNTKKLVKAKNFKINPFLVTYLANFLTGNSSSISIAKALILPRVLGTSITTSFGQNMQNFTSEVLSAYGSTTSGIDIEFIDQIDNNKLYCQLKLGPDTINKDDVETIVGHFNGIARLARTNRLPIANHHLVVGVLNGEPSFLNGNYKKIISEFNYPVFVGAEFWHRLTGDEYFYFDLVKALSHVAINSDFSSELENVISELSSDPEIIKLSDISD